MHPRFQAAATRYNPIKNTTTQLQVKDQNCGIAALRWSSNLSYTMAHRIARNN
jgi:hypothetical protein